MNPRIKVAKGCVDCAVTRNPAHRGQNVGPQHYTEMAFARTIIAGMPGMFVTFIHNFNMLR